MFFDTARKRSLERLYDQGILNRATEDYKLFSSQLRLTEFAKKKYPKPDDAPNIWEGRAVKTLAEIRQKMLESKA